MKISVFIKSFFFFFLSVFNCVYAQSGISYERSWGTFFGAFGTKGYSINNCRVVNEIDGNIVVDAFTFRNDNHPSYGSYFTASYYNQFITPGASGFDFTNYFSGSAMSSNRLTGIFMSSGLLNTAAYSPSQNQNAYLVQTVNRDESGNRYDIEDLVLTNPKPLLNYNTWLTNPNTSTYLDKILSKYDDSGQLQWKTYVSGYDGIVTASSGDVYVYGLTDMTNIGDVGTYVTDFQYYYPDVSSPVYMPNWYITKLNALGEKIWTTYVPVNSINSIDYYSGSLYLACNGDLNPADSNLATPGTFQQIPAGGSIIKLDTESGNRTWGTYYGVPGIFNGYIASIRADAGGIYVCGETMNPYTAGYSQSYYATPGAYQTTSEFFDLFLSKFTDNGSRVWGTYIGGADGYESLTTKQCLDINGSKVIISGVTGCSIASSGSFQPVKPSPVNEADRFFSMFNVADGGHIFTSYYDGLWESPTTSSYDLGVKFSSKEDAFYVFGSLFGRGLFDATTPNGYQTSIVYPNGLSSNEMPPRGFFLAKFIPKVLSINETDTGSGIILYDNPNNGNFSIRSEALEKAASQLIIRDASGRMVYQTTLKKEGEHRFALQNTLKFGVYTVSIQNKKLKQGVVTLKLRVK